MQHEKINLFLYVSVFDYPTRFAHALHGHHMARAFNDILGNKFRFLLNTVVEPKEFGIIPYVELFGPFGRRIKKLRLRRTLLPLVLAAYLLFRARRKTCVFVSDVVIARIMIRLRRFFIFVLVFECHAHLSERDARVIATHADRVVFVTRGLRDHFLSVHPDAKDIVVLLPNAVDPELYEKASVRDVRFELSIAPSVTLIGYLGRFEPLGLEKGLRFMIDALRELPADTHLLLVGATKKEATVYREYLARVRLLDRVHVVEFVHFSDMPSFALACNILAYVPSAEEEFFRSETSPMKLFEYMAAKKPIIVADTAATREILTDTEAYFITPGSLKEYVAAVEDIRKNPAEAAAKAARAKQKVLHQTWRARAERVVQECERML